MRLSCRGCRSRVAERQTDDRSLRLFLQTSSRRSLAVRQATWPTTANLRNESPPCKTPVVVPPYGPRNPLTRLRTSSQAPSVHDVGVLHEPGSSRDRACSGRSGDVCWRRQQLCGSYQLEDDGASLSSSNPSPFFLHWTCLTLPYVRVSFLQGFTLVTLSFLTILTNSALSFYRSSHRPTHAPPPHAQSQQHYLPPPPPHYAGLPRPDRGDPYAYGGGAWGAAGPSAAVGALAAGEQSGAVDLRGEKKGWFS